MQLGRNAQSIYQDLVERHGFEHRYNSVKRFVRTLRAREPQRFDVLEFLPGEEAQVDYGQGALTRTANGKYRWPYLFVMTLKYSGKSFRKVSWKTDQQIWAHLHEQAWRSFGGSTQYVVLDNLREGVITPDLYEPRLNPVYAAMLAHYGVVADVCRVGDPDRKGTVERAIQYTQDTALKGRRFESIEDKIAGLLTGRSAGRHRTSTAARNVRSWRCSPRRHRICGPYRSRACVTSNRARVPSMTPAPCRWPARTTPRRQWRCTARFWCASMPRRSRSSSLMTRHCVATRNQRAKVTTKSPTPSGSTTPRARPHACSAKYKRSGHTVANLPTGCSRASNLTRHYACAQIEAACARVLQSPSISYQSVKRILEHQAQNTAPVVTPLQQADPAIRPIDDYHRFWELNCQNTT